MSGEDISKVVKILEDHERRITALEGMPVKPKSEDKKLSIKEFLLMKKPKGFAKTVLAVGYYLEKYEGFTCFNIRDLEDGFRAAKEPLPKNINDTVNGNISQGYIMEAKEKKDNITAWVLTSTGEDYVEGNFKLIKK